MIYELYQKKMEVCNWQQKSYQKLPKIITSEQIIKTVTFIMSILLRLAFSYLKI